MNSKSQNSNQSWMPCPDGMISSVSSAITADQTVAARRHFLKSATGAAVVLSAAGFTGWSLLKPGSTFEPKPGLPGGVACSEVLANIPAYVCKTLDDQALFDAMTSHFALCSHCSSVRDCEVSRYSA